MRSFLYRRPTLRHKPTAFLNVGGRPYYPRGVEEGGSGAHIVVGGGGGGEEEDEALEGDVPSRARGLSQATGTTGNVPVMYLPSSCSCPG